MAEAYIVEALRTAGGRRKGAFAGTHPADLGAAVLNELVERTGVDPAAVEDVIVGCVSQAGEQAFAFGRNLVLASKLPDSVPAVTIDRQCGSSQQALHFAAQAVVSGTQDVVIAAGVESMTRVPMGSNFTLHAQAGLGEGPWPASIRDRYGVAEFSQFHGAQAIADKYGFSREDMDAYALESHRRAAVATAAGAFADEIVPVTTAAGVVDRDEGIRADASLEGMAGVKPLTEGGTITARTRAR
jgi:acetyl-CoA C-acetyltransferase